MVATDSQWEKTVGGVVEETLIDIDMADACHTIGRRRRESSDED